MEIIEKLREMRTVVDCLSKSVHPFTGEIIEEDFFFKDENVVIQLEKTRDFIGKEITKRLKRKAHDRLPLFLTEEEIEAIELPDRSIVITTFCRAVNQIADLEKYKGLHAIGFNKYLIERGYLTTEEDDDGKKNSIVTELGLATGAEMVEVTRNGRTFKKIIYNQRGKDMLLEILKDYIQ